MASLCASNQPHSVYPHISPLIHLCLQLPPVCTSNTMHHPSGPDAGPFVGRLAEVSINPSVIKQDEEEEEEKKEEERRLIVIKVVTVSIRRLLISVMHFESDRYLYVKKRELMHLPSTSQSWCKDNFMC